VEYASHGKSGEKGESPQPGRSNPRHGAMLTRLVSNEWNWAKEPPRPCMKTSKGNGGLRGNLSACGCGR